MLVRRVMPRVVSPRHEAGGVDQTKVKYLVLYLCTYVKQFGSQWPLFVYVGIMSVTGSLALVTCNNVRKDVPGTNKRGRTRTYID